MGRAAVLHSATRPSVSSGGRGWSRSANSQVLILIRDAIARYEEKHGKIEL